jgi:NAD(P)-dependent dehydrogenase (short-subunit alcohol dehydrogenase family)
MAKQPFYENVTIITGASSGIGREMAYQLADQGAWLALAGRDLEQLQITADVCLQRGGGALVVQTDVTHQNQCQNLIEKTISEYGRIDTLVNNAGISMWAMFEELSEFEIFERIMQTNYFGSIYCTHYALPHLKHTGGRLVAVSSLTGKTGVPTRSGYAASKHAMVGFFDSLRVELIGSGISVTVVYPDFVATETRRRALGADGHPLGKSPVQEDKIMSAEKCAQIAIRDMAKRRRESIQTPRAKIGQWIKLIAPGMVDRIALRAIQRGR